VLTLIAALAGLAVGAAVATALLVRRSGSRVQVATREAETIRREAQIDAREQAVKLRADIEQEIQDRRTVAAKAEERMVQREQEIDRKDTEVSRREQGLHDRDVHVRELRTSSRPPATTPSRSWNACPASPSPRPSSTCSSARRT
jgi:ribonuclease Y